MQSSKNVVKKQDSATELFSRFRQFLGELQIVLQNFPQLQKSVLGWRTGSKVPNQFRGIQSILEILHQTGTELLGKLNDTNETFESKINHMAALSEDTNTVQTIVNYLAASATIGVIQSDIRHVMKFMRKRLKISSPNDKFKNAFANLVALSANRSSKLTMMLEAIAKEGSKTLSEQTQAELEFIRKRFNKVAEVSDLMAAFSVYAVRPRKLSRDEKERLEQADFMQWDVLEEQRLEKLAERKRSGVADEADEFIEISAVSDDPKVIAIDKFSQCFDMDLLFDLLCALRKWKNGEKTGEKTTNTQVLNAVIGKFINYSDKALFAENATVEKEFKYKAYELEQLTAEINKWFAGEISDEQLQEYIQASKQKVMSRIGVTNDPALSKEALATLQRTLHALLGNEEEAEQAIDEEDLEKLKRHLRSLYANELPDLRDVEMLEGDNNVLSSSDVTEESSATPEPREMQPATPSVTQRRHAVMFQRMPYSAPQQNGQNDNNAVKGKKPGNNQGQ